LAEPHRLILILGNNWMGGRMAFRNGGRTSRLTRSVGKQDQDEYSEWIYLVYLYCRGWWWGREM